MLDPALEADHTRPMGARVHLVDGTYELFRAHFGAPSSRAPDGREVGAIRGLLRSLLGLLGEPEVTHLGVAFDHTVESFRNELFEGYKTGEGIDPELYAQFPLAEEASRALGLCTWPMIELEADDALATAARRLGEDAQVAQVLICSPDKDLMQCVRGDRVICVDRMRGKRYDAEGVQEKMGVPPSSIPDWLALVGDAADGIPGIPRWGAKSAAAALSAYGRLEAIPDDAERWTVKVRGAQRLAESLRAHREDALRYRALTRLREDAEIETGLEALRWRGCDFEALGALAESLGDRRLVGRAREVQGRRERALSGR